MTTQNLTEENLKIFCENHKASSYSVKAIQDGLMIDPATDRLTANGRTIRLSESQIYGLALKAVYLMYRTGDQNLVTTYLQNGTIDKSIKDSDNERNSEIQIPEKISDLSIDVIKSVATADEYSVSLSLNDIVRLDKLSALPKKTIAELDKYVVAAQKHAATYKLLNTLFGISDAKVVSSEDDPVQVFVCRVPLADSDRVLVRIGSSVSDGWHCDPASIGIDASQAIRAMTFTLERHPATAKSADAPNDATPDATHTKATIDV